MHKTRDGVWVVGSNWPKESCRPIINGGLDPRGRANSRAPGIPVRKFPGIPGNLCSLKFPAVIPGNFFKDFPKMSFFLDFDSSILPKTSIFRITFR